MKMGLSGDALFRKGLRGGKFVFSLAFLLFLTVLLPGKPAFAQGKDVVPVLELYRPAGRPGLAVAAWRSFGSSRIPFPGASILVKLPDGRTWFTRTDPLGVAEIPAGEILGAMEGSEGPATVRAAVSLSGKTAEESIGVTRGELIRLSGNAARAEVDRGNELARAGNYREAIRFYRRALDLDPECQRASYNIALAYEKLGMKRLAIEAYADYLTRFKTQAEDRESVKEKVLLLAKEVDPAPPVPANLLKVMEEGLKAALSGDFLRALGLYEAAQSRAPWWAEPYYASGMVYAHLSVQNTFHYADAALRCLGNFLSAAPPGDARIADVKKKLADFRMIKEGLNAPKTVPIH